MVWCSVLEKQMAHKTGWLEELSCINFRNFPCSLSIWAGLSSDYGNLMTLRYHISTLNFYQKCFSKNYENHAIFSDLCFRRHKYHIPHFSLVISRINKPRFINMGGTSKWGISRSYFGIALGMRDNFPIWKKMCWVHCRNKVAEY